MENKDTIENLKKIIEDARINICLVEQLIDQLKESEYISYLDQEKYTNAILSIKKIISILMIREQLIYLSECIMIN